MVFFRNGAWHASAETVTYTQHGETITQQVGVEGHDWWVDFAEKWDHTEIVSFDPVTLDAAQQERLEEINTLGIPDGHGADLGAYVRDGAFSTEPQHVLKQLEIDKLIDILIGGNA